MPKEIGKRYRLTLNGIKYDLSEAQYVMLTRKKLKLATPMEWKDEQRIVSLVKQGLFRKRNGAYERTKLGYAVGSSIHDRLAIKATAASKE